MGKKIYVASSWRNESQGGVVQALRLDGHDVYDFKNPRPGDTGFRWSEIDPAWKHWNPEEFRDALKHPVAESGFASDFSAMEWADEFCLVLPCGRSAHLEAGWAMGQGKRISLFIKDPLEPELMYLTGRERTNICVSLEEVLQFHRK